MKTQISVRVTPDTLAAIDAAARRDGVSRGHIVDSWLSASAIHNAPARRRSIEEMLLFASAASARALENQGTDTEVTIALDRIISAMRVMAGIDE